MSMLRRTDVPILCFADLVLFNDDLHDCGESELRLRLRLMPGCFFILLRHYLRVDGVFVRAPLGLYKILFTSRLLCTNQSSFYRPVLPALPALQQYYCTSIAHYTTPPRPPPFVCHAPYNIGNNNIRVNPGCG